MNQKIKIIVIEDEFVIAEDIRTLLQDNDYTVLHVFDKAEKAYPVIIKEYPDIILVDINLGGKMDGVELVTKVKATRQLPVVYITANSDIGTYERAKATHPNAFLIKPFTPPNLLATVDLAIANFADDIMPSRIERVHLVEPSPEVLLNQNLFLKANGRYKKIHVDEILFAEASGSYVHIQTTDQRYTLSQNLANFLRKTPLPNFVKIHRSFIVNVNKVESFDESSVFVARHQLPLSDNCRAEFMARVHFL
jgi:DNA-binding LytR/AlgR family response regulator